MRLCYLENANGQGDRQGPQSNRNNKRGDCDEQRAGGHPPDGTAVGEGFEARRAAAAVCSSAIVGCWGAAWHRIWTFEACPGAVAAERRQWRSTAYLGDA